MELKLRGDGADIRGPQSFNRTSVELKLGNVVELRPPLRPFNRTSVELKLLIEVTQADIANAFNRTSVELKLQRRLLEIGDRFDF